MTEQQQKVKVVDTVVRVNDEDDFVKWLVLRVHDAGLEVIRWPHFNVAHNVLFLPWSHVRVPEAPKARPGVRYRHPMGNQAFGLADGRIWNVSSWDITEFSDAWREVAE